MSSSDEDSVDGPKIAEPLRFSTSWSGDKRISLREYVGFMSEGQQDILFVWDGPRRRH